MLFLHRFVSLLLLTLSTTFKLITGNAELIYDLISTLDHTSACRQL